MSKCITKIKVMDEHIDRMGHLNNSKYFEFMTRGRTDWYEQAGVTFESLRKQDLGRVVVNINIDFIKEVLEGEFLSIETTPIKFGRTSFVLKQVIKTESGEIASAAEVTNVIFDRNKRCSAPLPKALKQFLKKVAPSS